MKKIINILAEEFLYGDHIVGLAAVGMISSVILIFDLPGDFKILAIAYLTYLIIYSYNHLSEIGFDSETNPERVSYLLRKRKWKLISFIVYIILLSVLLLFANRDVRILILLIVLGGILYTKYFKTVAILGIKNYYAAFFWSLLALLVALYYDLNNILPFLYLMSFLFIRVFLNTVFFDIKDIQSDKERNLKTFPVCWGKKKTLYILQIINLLSLVPLIIGIYNNNVPLVALSFIIVVLNGIFYLTKALFLSKKDLRFLSYVLLDGEYMLWPIIILIGKIFI